MNFLDYKKISLKNSSPGGNLSPKFPPQAVHMSEKNEDKAVQYENVHVLPYLYMKSIILNFFYHRFGDFAVGAPFEDNGAGVVILYFGRKDIEYIDKKEIIKASPGHMGFGASFSKKYMDIDNNQLSDLAIGSYMSGRGDS